jgi:glutamate dehydrogenase/leucine dehydrogenase
MSQSELQRMTRRFTNGISHVIGVYRDIPAPDVNTNAQTMAWMMDAFSAMHGYSPVIVTGKPLAIGGQPGREAATGRGIICVLAAYAEEHGLDANAGGVTGSYFEWTREIQQMPWTEARFNKALRDYMTRAYRATSAFARERAARCGRQRSRSGSNVSRKQVVSGGTSRP